MYLNLKRICGHNPEAHELLVKYNFSGTLVDPEVGDYAYVVQTNLGGDKTNWFVGKEVTHELTKEKERYVRTVKVNYTYDEPGGEFVNFVTRFRDWTRLYVPSGSELISVEGSEVGSGEGAEGTKTYFHGYVTLGPGESTELVFKYYLPEGIVTGDTYNLYIQKQSGIVEETHNVVVNGKKESVQVRVDQEYSTSL
jgi:hypothetical protein